MELMITLIVVLIIILMLRIYLVQGDVKKLQKAVKELQNNPPIISISDLIKHKNHDNDNKKPKSKD